MLESKFYKIGFEGESLVRDFLAEKKICEKFFQADIIAKVSGKWYYIEVKTQEMYLSPPFNGHGLKLFKINVMLELYKECGIIPILWVVDNRNKCFFYNDLRKLESGEKFDTNGKRQRRIYHIDNFKKVKF